MSCKNVIERNYRKNPQRLGNIETTGHDFLQHPQNGFNYEIPWPLNPVKAPDSQDEITLRKILIITSQ